MLNSKPIGLVSDDPEYEVILTPGHLISKSQLECYPTEQSSQTSDLKGCSATARWIHIQNDLWTKESSNLKVGDVVYVMDDNAATLQWPLARVSYMYSKPESFVRVVLVRASTG